MKLIKERPRTNRSALAIAGLSLAVTSLMPQAASAQDRPTKVRYAKTEVDKARGKCVVAVLLGGLAGAAVGAAVDGRRGAGRGALVGVGAGAIACAVIMSNAKRSDRITAAQIAAASARDGRYQTTFADDNGQPVQYQAVAGPKETVDAARLIPVKYQQLGGGQVASPVLDTGGRECRQVGGTLSGTTGAAATPPQYVCRTANGDYAPYELGKGAKT